MEPDRWPKGRYRVDLLVPPEPWHMDGQQETAPSQPQGGGWGAGLPGLLIPPGVKVMPPGRPVLEHSAALSGAARHSFCSLSPQAHAATGHSLLLSPGWP